MPDTLRKDIIDLVWSKVEAWFARNPAPLDNFKPGNRSRQTHAGKLREMTRKLPADFGHWKCVVERMTHSLWGGTGTLARDKQAFRDSTTDFSVSRSARVVFTIRTALTKEDTEEDVNLGDEVVKAIFDAGPKLGVDWVVGAGDAAVEERETRTDELPRPGKVITVTFDIQCQQMGRALLTSNTP